MTGGVVIGRAAARQREYRLNLVLGVGLVVMLAAATVACSTSLQSEKAEYDTAKDRCRSAVAQRLKAPSTAQFPEVGSGNKIQLTDNDVSFMRSQFPKFDPSSVSAVWVVSGAVDAQNSYGAAIRSNFECRAIFIGGNFSSAYVNSLGN
jgi:hypothetical protein